MTQQEAINILDRRTTIPGDGFTWEQINEAIDMAIAALVPISQKRVEEIWRGEWINNEEAMIDSVRCSKCKTVFQAYYGDYQFCPHCGAPMTDEAVDMVMERLEALRGETETD